MDTDRILRILVDDATSVIGVASVIAAVLREALPPLREYANKSLDKVDDGIVEKLGVALTLLTMVIDGVHRLANVIGLNPPIPPEKPAQNEPGDAP